MGLLYTRRAAGRRAYSRGRVVRGSACQRISRIVRRFCRRSGLLLLSIGLFFTHVGSLLARLLVVVRLGSETHRPTVGAGIAVIVVAVQGSYRFGDVVARIGYRQLGGVATSTRKAPANIAGSG